MAWKQFGSILGRFSHILLSFGQEIKHQELIPSKENVLQKGLRFIEPQTQASTRKEFKNHSQRRGGRFPKILRLGFLQFTYVLVLPILLLLISPSLGYVKVSLSIVHTIFFVY